VTRDRLAARCLAWLPAVVVSGSVAAATIVPERVTFDSFDRDPATGAAVRISALLFRPDGSGDVRRAAVVALHGCGGMYSAVKSRRDQLSLRHQAMAELLVGEGYVVLFPDSFRSRGRQEVCTIKAGESSVPAAKRKLDALGALAYLAQRRDIARDRIALVGWSHGGSATLATINARDREVNAFRERPDAPPFFRAAVAFYPGCRASLAAGERWETAIPTRILIGELDDWTPPKPCVDLGAAAAARGEPLKVTVFPGAHHGFDAPGATVIHRTDVPNGVAPGQGVHVGANPEMRDKANAKLRAFLDEALRARAGD